MKIRTQKITVTTVGGAGVAEGDADSEVIIGHVIGIHLDYDFSQGVVTTDVTVTTKETPAQTVLAIADSVTDDWYYPRVLTSSTAGADLTAEYDYIYVNGKLNVSAVQGDAGTIIATVLYMDYIA